MVTTKLVRFAARAGLCAAAVLALAACGSNDNGYVCGYDAFGDPLFCSIPTTPSPPTQPAPVASTDTFDTAAAMTNVATQTFSYTVSGYDSSGNSYTVVYASTPGGSASFQTGAATPVPAVTANVTETFSENGSSPSVTTIPIISIRRPTHFSVRGAITSADMKSWRRPRRCRRFPRPRRKDNRRRCFRRICTVIQRWR